MKIKNKQLQLIIITMIIMVITLPKTNKINNNNKNKDLIHKNMKVNRIKNICSIKTICHNKEDFQMKEKKRDPYTFKSGAVYTGEWRGHMRDGYGI